MALIVSSPLRSAALWPPRCAIGAIAAAVILAILITGGGAFAHEDYGNRVSITVQGGQRCIISNGLPDHATGRFPNRGNPNTISPQNFRLCVPARPRKNAQPMPVRHGPVGVAINGVLIRPEAAEYYDSSGLRGFSRDPRSGWRVEPLGVPGKFGMDHNNAHVDRRGIYHYHAVPKALVASAHGSLIGYAADGFEIHYVGKQQTSSYRLKSGIRPSGPGGRHDGSYVQDWQYVGGLGTLDACNGGMLDGKFVYFATDTFPFFPRCLWGTRSADFERDLDHGPGLPSAGRRPAAGPRNAGLRPGPPPEAVAACAGLSDGTRCAFNPPGRRQKISGTCLTTPAGAMACVPRGLRPPL